MTLSVPLNGPLQRMAIPTAGLSESAETIVDELR